VLCHSGEKLPVEAERVKGTRNSAVQQHQSAENNGSSLRIYFHKRSTKAPDPQLKTTPVTARTRVSRSSLSDAGNTNESDSVKPLSRRSPTSKQSTINSPVNVRSERNSSHDVETASTSTSGKQSKRTALESRGASRAFCSRDVTDCQNKKHGSCCDRSRMNRCVSPACSHSERNERIDSEQGRLSKSPPNTAGHRHHCRHQVSQHNRLD